MEQGQAVYESGHEVPFYQPVVALEMFERAIKGLDVATGEMGGKGKVYHQGYAKEGNSTIQFEVVGDGQNVQCDAEEGEEGEGSSFRAIVE